ncbi:hypothetical protein CSOJ01_16118 [Colletotrichum sojae]|uniref:Uncharacterized protein n=1 Tax=Colletotrichum sojae TaxID=2175907 RepID=A0A8H6ILA8_9PEZI|nr:hypothetical protein CSOJ01_16118 [Colletotrichum sojae]
MIVATFYCSIRLRRRLLRTCTLQLITLVSGNCCLQILQTTASLNKSPVCGGEQWHWKALVALSRPEAMG